MAARPTWKGHLKISLVNIPVRVFPATDSAATISFNQLHAECQSRVRQKRWCPTCEAEVSKSDVVKGFEFEKGRYVVMTDDDLSKVRPESTRVINLVRFTEAPIDPAYVERPYYLAPDGPVAAEAFAVVREAMKGKAGIGKLALNGQEHLIAVQARDRGLIMYTLRHARELRRMEAIDELEHVPTHVNRDEVALARQVMQSFEGNMDLSEFRDQYQEDLRAVIDAKVAGAEVVAPVEDAPPKVVNLMEALRKSLDSVSDGKRQSQRKANVRPIASRATGRRRGRA